MMEKQIKDIKENPSLIYRNPDRKFEDQTSKKYTKPCKYSNNCKYFSKDKCWFSHATVDKVESAYQQSGNPYESMNLQNLLESD